MSSCGSRRATHESILGIAPDACAAAVSPAGAAEVGAGVTRRPVPAGCGVSVAGVAVAAGLMAEATARAPVIITPKHWRLMVSTDRDVRNPPLQVGAFFARLQVPIHRKGHCRNQGRRPRRT